MVADPPRKGEAKSGEKNRKLRNPAEVPSERVEAPASIDPEYLSPDLCRERERLYAISTSYRFQDWLTSLAAYERIPLDNCLSTISLLTTYCEVMLVAAVADAWRMTLSDEPDAITESDAAEMGLTIEARHDPRKRIRATLPGCHGSDKGLACMKLRRYGEKFCPGCRAKELKAIRGN